MKIYVDGSKRHAVSRMFPEWEKMGHAVVDSHKKANVQLSVVRISKTHGLPTVLRLDGVYYDADTDYKHRNKSISKAHQVSDGVIYQSYTAKKMSEVFLGERKGQYAVIHNGINPSEWDRPIPHRGINVIACSKWRRPKRLEETIEVFNKFRAICPDARLHVIGGFKKNYKPIESDGVEYYGQVDHKQMIDIYSIGDMYIHLCKKDSCPSSVVEAIAAGLPVVTTNACGGATEMSAVSSNCFIAEGEAEAFSADYIYQDEYNRMPDIVQDRLVEFMKIIADKKLRSKLPKQLHIKEVAKRYIEFMHYIVRTKQ